VTLHPLSRIPGPKLAGEKTQSMADTGSNLVKTLQLMLPSNDILVRDILRNLSRWQVFPTDGRNA